jgi:hypothetical protein
METMNKFSKTILQVICSFLIPAIDPLSGELFFVRKSATSVMTKMQKEMFDICFVLCPGQTAVYRYDFHRVFCKTGQLVPIEPMLTFYSAPAAEQNLGLHCKPISRKESDARAGLALLESLRQKNRGTIMAVEAEVEDMKQQVAEQRLRKRVNPAAISGADKPEILSLQEMRNRHKAKNLNNKPSHFHNLPAFMKPTALSQARLVSRNSGNGSRPRQE